MMCDLFVISDVLLAYLPSGVLNNSPWVLPDLCVQAHWMLI